METYTYLVNTVKEIPLEQLRKELIILEEEYSDEELITIIQIKPEQKGALIITPNKDFVAALHRNKDFVLTLQT